MLGETLPGGTAMVEDRSRLEGPALEESVQPLEPPTEVDQACSVDILIGTVVPCLQMGWWFRR